MTQTDDIRMVVTHDRKESQPIIAPTRIGALVLRMTVLWFNKLSFFV